MSPVRIGLIGYAGRMGQAIAGLIAADPRATLAGGLVESAAETADLPFLTTAIDELAPRCDVMIDFSSPGITAQMAQKAAQHGKAYLCGTTGIGPDAHAAFQKAAVSIPLLYSANMSFSLAVMKRVAELAASLLKAEDYDIAITDRHHRMKKDAPSGTAKALGDAVLKGNGGSRQPEYSAVRAGFIVGEHEILFAGQGEAITLKHEVTDRAIFARGALTAALWLAGQKAGHYAYEDIITI